jgi:anti-sigma-K factor RskA
MSALDRERAEELAALSAAGAATADEIQELNTLCVQSREIAALVREYEEAVTALAVGLGPVAPPPGALDAIRQRIAAEPAPRASQPAPVASLAEHRARSARQRWTQVMAVVAAVAAVALGALWNRERQTAAELAERVTDLSERVTASESTTRELQGLIVAERERRTTVELALAAAERRVEHIESPSLQLATLKVSDQPRAPKAKIFIDPDNRRWLVLAYDLPPIDPDQKDYQLWFIPRIEGGAPIPAGLLQKNEDGVYEAEIEVPRDLDVGLAAISLEKKGGVEVPTDVQMAGPVL